MAKYTANTASSVEAGGGSGFRIAKDGERVKVVFLYSDPSSIDGWACHRFTKPNGVTTVVDCPRSPKDPIDVCPACKAKQQLYTRIFVRMLNLNTNEVTIWDKASSFRRDLVGFMEYFNPLYSRVYEITRRGTGLQTTYQFQSLNESGITPERYEELVQEADKFAENYVRPIESYESVVNDWEIAKEKQKEDEVNVSGNQQAPGAWGQPPQGNWGQQPPQNWGQQPAPQPGWGQQSPQNTPQNTPPQNWGQPPQGNPSTGTPQENPSTNPPQSTAPQNIPQNTPPQGNWGQPPQNWGQPPQGN